MIHYDTIRLLAVIAIVLLHVAANGVNDLPFGSMNWWMANVIDSACRAGVPLFLMLSGALLLHKNHKTKEQSVSEFYRRRWQRLAAPVLLWSLFYLAWTQLKAWWKNQPLTVDDTLRSALSGEPYFHLWYLYMLIGLYAVLPWFRLYWQRLSDKQQLWLLLGSIILQQSLMQLRFFQQELVIVPDWLTHADQLPWPLWFIGYLPYVMLGAVLAKQIQQPAQHFWFWLGLLVCSIAIIAIGYATQCDAFDLQQTLDNNVSPFAYSYHRLNWPVLFCGICYWQVLRHCTIQPLPAFAHSLVTHSFGIYLVHPVWLDVSSMLLQHQALQQAPYVMLLIIRSIFVVAASLVSCKVWSGVTSKLVKTDKGSGVN